MRRSIPLPVIACLSAALAACQAREAPSRTPERPNILLVTVDTLRADHVGVYGYAGAATPAIDALAARGVLFETAIAPAPLTGPSHASILTGLTPLRHGFRNNSGFALAPSIRTAAEEFKAAGYRTAAFVSAFPLDRRFGFARGFDRYDDRLPRGHDPRRPPYIERPADATTDAVLRWLAEPAGSGAGGAAPWFLWVHYYDPHAPYEPPPDLAQRFAQQPYDGEIAHVDRQLDRLLEQIDAGRTIVLVTADHGESLGEHGEGTHGIFVYDATIRVPWVMAGPGVPVARVAATVARSIDVLPTLGDYAGLGPRSGIEGQSLKPAAEGRRMPEAPAYAESLYPELELGWAPLHAWRTPRTSSSKRRAPSSTICDRTPTRRAIAPRRIRRSSPSSTPHWPGSETAGAGRSRHGGRSGDDEAAAGAGLSQRRRGPNAWRRATRSEGWCARAAATQSRACRRRVVSPTQPSAICRRCSRRIPAC